MNIQNVDLSALISTKICHDLINPIGAISNGLELLDAVGTAPGPEMTLLNDSTSAATAKLNVFRLAFGDASSSAEVKGETVEQLISAMYEGGRLRIHWAPEEKAFPRNEIKLCFLLLFCIESSLPFGGDCTISKAGETWSLRGTGRKVKIRDNLWPIVTQQGETANVSASDVHFLVARLTAEQIGRSITMKHDDETITVGVAA